MVRIQRKQNLARRIDSQRQVDTAEMQDDNVLVKRKVPLKHIVQFTRLLATMTEAGLPVLRNLRIRLSTSAFVPGGPKGKNSGICAPMT